MDFALEGIQKYDDYNKDTYTLFYKRFEDFFSLIGEK